MFSLIKLGAGLIGLAAFAWFGITVKLGEYTLFQHVRAIVDTKETQKLVDGTKQAAGPLVDDVRRHVSGGAAANGNGKQAPDAGAPLERLSSSEQRQLRELLKKMR